VSRPDLGLSVPLLDEAGSVDGLLSDLRAATDAAGIRLRVALVDNGSTDGTGARIDALAAADPAGVVAVHLAENAGYGGGILAGLRALRAVDPPPVLGWAWGDRQVAPSVLPALYGACRAGAPLAKARRVERQDGPQRVLVTATYGAVMRALGVVTPDVNGCPKLFRAEALEALALRSTDWFIDAEAVLGAEARGWQIADAPVIMRPRAAGRSKVRVATVVEFARNLLGRRRRGLTRS